MSDPDIDPAHVTITNDGQTEKYWDPAWGDEGAAPQGVSYLDPEGGHEDEDGD